MALISDGLLLAAAIAAIFYCWAVSRRLGGLKQQSADLTAKLSQLDETVAGVRAAISEGRDLAAAENERLNEVMECADKLRVDLKCATLAYENSNSNEPAAEEPDENDDALARIKRLNRRQKSRIAS